MKLDYLAETFVPELDLTASLLYYVRIKHRRYNTKLMQTRGKELLWGGKKKADNPKKTKDSPPLKIQKHSDCCSPNFSIENLSETK